MKVSLLSKAEAQATYWSMLHRCYAVSVHLSDRIFDTHKMSSEEAAREGVEGYMEYIHLKKPDTQRAWAIACDGKLIDSGIDEIEGAA